VTSLVRWYALAGVIVIVDQATKWLASSGLSYAMPVKIFSWFNWPLQHNQGAAFSFVAGAGGWQRWFFAALACVVSVLIVYWMRDLKSRQWQLSLALALILGGALGNLVDRIYLGYVVDFISAHYRDRYFPTFNVADAAISVGAFFMVIDSVFNTAGDKPVTGNGNASS